MHFLGAQTRLVAWSAFLTLLLTLIGGGAYGATINCERIINQTDATICGQSKLLVLDIQLGRVYQQRLLHVPQLAGQLQRLQLYWLKQRDRCQSNVRCIERQYRRQLRVLADQPDQLDQLALHDLHGLLTSRTRVDAEMALPWVLAQLAIKNGMSYFSNISLPDGGGEKAAFPLMRPSGVSLDEWRALQASNVAEISGENGQTSYTLLDMDGDGRRDLIVEVYAGGTGLWSYTWLAHRQGRRFVTVGMQLQEDDLDSSFFAINDRGANQRVTWIRLQGRVYAAYRDSQYGKDAVYLLRPFIVRDQVPMLWVHYRYQLAIPRMQAEDSNSRTLHAMEASQHTALSAALRNMAAEQKKRTRETVNLPLCPPPEGQSKEEGEAYSTYGPGHYSYEVVADFSAWISGRCHLARLIDWFGHYDQKEKLYAQLQLRLPDGDDEQSYRVKGLRRISSLQMVPTARFDMR
ncbi:hypothetical protein ACFOLG_17455 [Vogesella facilis]|uniref:Lysozyme inhibitor LprI N-terminal domain-containing protein n=1 Tax=Vogesella facilis TaxID=1655232 RepID=A0ABV7RIV4_9NEIS